MLPTLRLKSRSNSRLIFRLVSLLWVAVISTTGFTSNDFQVPRQINSIDMLDELINIQTKPNNRALAMSDNGSFGSSWSYPNKRAAMDAAVKNCQTYAEGQECVVVSVNGKAFKSKTMAASELRQQLKSQASQQQKPVPANRFPLGVADSKKRRDGFAEYAKQTGQKAFAVSPNGAWGYQTQRADIAVASREALATCNRHSDANDCRLVDVNHDLHAGSVTMVQVGNQWQAKLTQVPKIIPTFRGIERYASYMSKLGHKALAVRPMATNTPRGEVHFVAGQLSSGEAEKAALALCKKHTAKDCQLVAVNQKVIGELVDRPNKPQTATLSSLNQQALPEFLKRYQKAWNSADPNWAVASNGEKSVGYVKNIVSTEIAQEHALTICESMRKARQELNSICKVVIVNGELTDPELLKAASYQVNNEQPITR